MGGGFIILAASGCGALQDMAQTPLKKLFTNTIESYVRFWTAVGLTLKVVFWSIILWYVIKFLVLFQEAFELTV